MLNYAIQASFLISMMINESYFRVIVIMINVLQASEWLNTLSYILWLIN